MVKSINNLKLEPAFHQEELFLLEGRYFSQEEIDNRECVIIIPVKMASRLEKTIGDTIDLSIAIPDATGIMPDYWQGHGFLNQDTFKIVGIFNNAIGSEWHVFVPESAGVPYSERPVGYTVALVNIKNDQADAFFLRINPEMPDRFMLTIYDQGYASTAVPFQNILRIAQLITIICAVVELVVLMNTLSLALYVVERAVWWLLHWRWLS